MRVIQFARFIWALHDFAYFAYYAYTLSDYKKIRYETSPTYWSDYCSEKPEHRYCDETGDPTFYCEVYQPTFNLSDYNCLNYYECVYECCYASNLTCAFFFFLAFAIES